MFAASPKKPYRYSHRQHAQAQDFPESQTSPVRKLGCILFKIIPISVRASGRVGVLDSCRPCVSRNDNTIQVMIGAPFLCIGAVFQQRRIQVYRHLCHLSYTCSSFSVARLKLRWIVFVHISSHVIAGLKVRSIHHSPRVAHRGVRVSIRRSAVSCLYVDSIILRIFRVRNRRGVLNCRDF